MRQSTEVVFQQSGGGDAEDEHAESGDVASVRYVGADGDKGEDVDSDEDVDRIGDRMEGMEVELEVDVEHGMGHGGALGGDPTEIWAPVGILHGACGGSTPVTVRGGAAR